MTTASNVHSSRSETDTLYKFRSYSTPVEQERIEEILLGHRIFVPSPSTFNDPFDPRPKYAVTNREKALYRYGKIARKEFGANSNAERTVLKADMSALIKEITHKYQRVFRNDSRVLSLTGTREPILLWSHYAANHTGLCVHFSRSVAPFAWAMPVRYTDDYPVIEIPIVADHTEVFTRTFCTKASVWAYESEFRLARLPESMREVDVWNSWDGNHMLITPEAVTGISMGANISEENRAKLSEICRMRAPQIELWQAALHDSQFALTFTRVN